MENRRKTKRWRVKRQVSVVVSLSALALVSFLVNQGTFYAAGETDWLNVSVDSVTINTSPFKGGNLILRLNSHRLLMTQQKRQLKLSLQWWWRKYQVKGSQKHLDKPLIARVQTRITQLRLS